MLKGQHEEDILRSVHSFHMMTTNHVVALHYATSSRRYVSGVLKSMVERKLLHCPTRPYVNLPNVYMLGIRGVRVLNAIGITAHIHPSNYTYPLVMLNHIIATNDALIAAKNIPARCDNYEVIEILHDKTMKQMIDEAYHKEKIITNVVGDGLVVLKEVNDSLVLWLEVDRGTEDQKKIRKKIRDTLEFAKRDFEHVFGYRSFAQIYITTESETRRDTLRLWCERELSELYEERQASMFWFAYVPEREIKSDMFFNPIWRVPFAPDFYMLLQC